MAKIIVNKKCTHHICVDMINIAIISFSIFSSNIPKYITKYTNNLMRRRKWKF